MKIDLFLKLDGIDGEATDDRHRNEIELLSYNWSESQQVIHSGGGGGAGKVQVQDLYCSLYFAPPRPSCCWQWPPANASSGPF